MFHQTIVIITVLILLFLLSACGGGGEDYPIAPGLANPGPDYECIDWREKEGACFRWMLIEPVMKPLDTMAGERG